MKEEEFIKVLSYLGSAFGKEYTKAEVQLHYDFLKNYSYEIFKKTIQNIIKTSRFLPKVSELVEECENSKKELQFEIINYMEDKGYFKNPIELEKATRFLERGIIPKWLKEDMKKYYNMMNLKRIENNKKMIGE